MFWSLLKKLSHLLLIGVSLILKPQSSHGDDQLSFVDATYQLFQGKDFDNSLVGKFELDSCAQILSRRTEDRQVWIASRDKPAIPAIGLPTSFPLQQALVLDLNHDGLSDLVGYEKNSRQWHLAISEGDGRFRALTQELIPLNGLQSYSLIGPVGDGPQLEVDLEKEHMIVKYSAERGLFVDQTLPKGNGVRLLGALDAPKDRTLVTTFSEMLLGVPAKESKIDRLNHDTNFTWADFPFPIQTDRLLLADFNGDGFSDVLTPGWHFQKWWIALGHGSTAVEYPIQESRSLPAKAEAFIAADFDCDGRSDLISRKIKNGLVEVFYSRVSKDILTDPDKGHTQQLVGRALSSEEGPFACVGYIPFSNDGKWGYSFSCPKGYAVSSSTLTADAIVGACCRLPKADILLEERIGVAGDSCPENMVITGSPGIGKLDCTAINLDRYALRERVEAVHWGFGSIKVRESKSVQKARVPLALRHSFGRRQLQSWLEEGCAGYPWGSLLSAWGPRTCARSKYQTLVYKGAPGDPPMDTPVQMYPECRGGLNPFDPNAGCFQ